MPEGERENRKVQLPWLDERGLPLGKTALRKICKKWPPEVWTLYLEWFETPLKESLGFTEDQAALLSKFRDPRDEDSGVELQQFEFEPERHMTDKVKAITSLPLPEEGKQQALNPIEEFKIQDDAKPVAPILPDPYISEADERQDALRAFFEKAMKSLTKRERDVLIRTFWLGMTEWQIAINLKRSRWSVRTWKARAIQKLRPLAEAGLSPKFPIDEGTPRNLEPKSVRRVPERVFRKSAMNFANAEISSNPKG